MSSQPPLARGPCWVAVQTITTKGKDNRCIMYVVHIYKCSWTQHNELQMVSLFRWDVVNNMLGCYGLGLKHVSWVMTLKERWRLTSFQKNWYADIFRLSSHFIDYNCIGLLDPKNSNECCNDPNDQNFDKAEHKMWNQFIINFGHNFRVSSLRCFWNWAVKL